MSIKMDYLRKRLSILVIASGLASGNTPLGPCRPRLCCIEALRALANPPPTVPLRPVLSVLRKSSGSYESTWRQPHQLPPSTAVDRRG